MNYQQLIDYMTLNAEETYGDNGDTVHYLGQMPLCFQFFEDFRLLEADGYIDDITP